ncbi:FtsX-like permease family protein [Blattabacterium sp. DPU]|uniref:ABC transporter permease n=1 Tax=Blattabacterium sp. DPU TaxID=2715232 RepID=UPI0014087301|nr:FtsX-like permease family protein [Blattabacterium sp. DPU]QIK16455.1 FtsX-like permease family protein [Blattabacterium sp. DPU]
MNTSFYISIRYFFSKKKTNIVNIIVFLSIFSISISTFSLSTILFIFSGLKDLNKKFYQIHYPDITISYSNEKKFFFDDNIIKKIKYVPGILFFSKTMEKKVFLYDKNHTYFLLLKGVDMEYEKVMSQFTKTNFKKNINIFDSLNIYVGWSSMISYFPIFFHIINKPLKIFIFDYKKNQKNILIPFFIKKKIHIKGIYHFSSKIDNKYLFCDLYELQNTIQKKVFHRLEIKTHHKANIYNIKNILIKKLGPKFNIITRSEKERIFYRVLNTEKIFIYFLFTLMTLITGFNLFSAIFILQLDKVKELFTLWSLGFSLHKIKTIFFYMGFMITIFGCLIGLLMSYIVFLIQKKYKIFKVGKKIPFPIKITVEDAFVVVSIILIIGSIISFFSLKRISNMIYK